jgi:hypothetical protein
MPLLSVVPAGYHGRMAAYSSEELEVIQGVVDRVSSYQDGAPERTVERELDHGLAEVGLEVSDEDVARLAAAIEDEHGSIDATSVLRPVP